MYVSRDSNLQGTSSFSISLWTDKILQQKGWLQGVKMKNTDILTQSVFSCSVVSDSLQPQWSPPGSMAHGISQARILDLVAFSFSMNTVYQISIKKRKTGHEEKSTIKTEQVQWVCLQHRSQIKERAVQKGAWHTVGTHSVDSRGKNEWNDEEGNGNDEWNGMEWMHGNEWKWWRRMENVIGRFLCSPWRLGRQLQAQRSISNKPPCFKITKNSEMVTTGHEALCSCSCSPPQLALLLPRYPSCSRAPQCFQATVVLSSNTLFPLPCLGFPTHTRALFPNMLLYVWPLNLSLCLLAPE